MWKPERVIAWFIVGALFAPSSVVAQTVRGDSPQLIRRSIASIDFSGLAAVRTSAPAFQGAGGGRQRSAGRKIAGGVIGGVGGFFAGGYLGAAIDGECGGCDDPGLMGALIGAPIGAVVGAILGVKFF
jgi:hypothetical protein